MGMIKAGGYADMSRKAAHVIFAQVISKADSVTGLATGSTPAGICDRLAGWHRKADRPFAAVRSINPNEYCGGQYYVQRSLKAASMAALRQRHVPEPG